MSNFVEKGFFKIAGNTVNADFLLAVGLGKIPGYSVIDKFGSAENIPTSTPSDVWEGADPALRGNAIYPFTVIAGTTYYFSSTDNADTQSIKLSVLTVDNEDNWNNESFEQVLVGQTKTAIVTPSGDPIVRIYRAENEADAGNDLAGICYIYEDDTVTLGKPDTANKVRAIINNGTNQTLMTIYTIPSGKVGFLLYGDAAVSRSGGVAAAAQLSYRSRRAGKVFKVKKKVELNTQGTGVFQDYRRRPDPIPEKTDIVIRVDDVSATLGIASAFDILLVDEELIDLVALTS